MKSQLKAWPLLLVMGFASAAAAAEKFDPAARARVIAPFVDEQTVAVIRVDMTRVSLDALYEELGRLFPEGKEDFAAERPRAGKMLAQFTEAGGKDVYFVVTTALVPHGPPGFLVVPIHPGVDEKALRAALPGRNEAAQRIGDALVIAERQAMLEHVRTLKPDPRPELAAAFAAAGDTAAQAVLVPPAYTRRVVDEMMPELPKQIGGGSSKVFTRGLTWAAAGIDPPPRLSVKLVVESQDAQTAEALRAKLLEVLRIVGQIKEVRQKLPNFDQAVAVLAPKVEGDRLVLVLSEQSQAIRTLMTALSVPLDQARQAARRQQSVNNLKQIALAVHNFHDVYKSFPAQASRGPDGKPLLSWRVHILPFIEQRKLYEQFHLNEPWDSPHNKVLIDKMPQVYRSPASKLREKGKTNYLVAVGPGTVFGGREGMRIQDIKDGTSNTIMVVEANDQHVVIWTRPEDLPYDPKDPGKGLWGLYEGGTNLAICDGSVRFVSEKIDPEILRRLFGAADGKPVEY